MNASSIEQAPNIVALPVERKKPAILSTRFKIVEYTNPRTDGTSFRVTGTKRTGERVRENFPNEAAARCRQSELENEFLQGHAETAIQATKLTNDQIRLCEAAILTLGEDWTRVVEAANHWKQNGKQHSAIESPELDDAIDKYLLWLDASTFRDATKRHWKTRITVFKNSVGRTRVADVTPEFIETFLAGRKTSAVGKDTDRRAVSRFFSWCIEKKWIATNPARKQTRTRKGDTAPPAVLTVKQCKALLKASEREGLAPYVAVCMFGGIRPTETSRLTWQQVNLKDREIRIEGNQAKMRKPRVVAICDTLAAWLEAHKGKAFYPANWRRKFDAVKAKAKITEWPADVLRHTAASHYFRQSGSYGRTAEQFGNSEAIIKAHYQGRVTSDETKKFYALRPAKGGRK